MTEDLHKILERYVDNASVSAACIFEIVGYMATATGVFVQSVPSTIAGMTLLAGGFAGEGIAYYKAYCSARLDFMRNGRFTKLEEEVQKGSGK
jgi:hypothetical protein